MKTIPLTNGYFTKVDNDDYEKFAIYRWYAALDSRSKTHRAARRMKIEGYKRGKIVFLSRLIVNAPDGICVDHINHDTLDNRKINLRFCDKSTNGMNRGANKNNKSGYKGVSWSKEDNRWTAHINKTIDGKYKQFFIGNFQTKELAAEAYNKKAKELFGEFACLNKIK